MASRERFIVFSCLTSLSYCEMLRLPVGTQSSWSRYRVLTCKYLCSATEGEEKVGVTREAAVSPLPYISVHDFPCCHWV